MAAVLLANDPSLTATEVASSLACLATPGALSDVPSGTLNLLLFGGAAMKNATECVVRDLLVFSPASVTSSCFLLVCASPAFGLAS